MVSFAIFHGSEVLRKAAISAYANLAESSVFFGNLASLRTDELYLIVGMAGHFFFGLGCPLARHGQKRPVVDVNEAGMPNFFLAKQVCC